MKNNYRLIIIQITGLIKNSKIDEALLLVDKYGGAIVKMIINILNRWEKFDSKEQLIMDESVNTIRVIEKYGGIISTVATVSPMLGLLGTVTGMMKSFSSLAKQGASAQEMLAQGITEALITTALGLLVAIPSMIFYNYMVSKVEFYINEVEYIANSLGGSGFNENDNSSRD